MPSGGQQANSVTTRFCSDHASDCVDQGEVREGLREVAKMSPAPLLDLFREQQQRAGGRQRLLAQVARPLELADLHERRDEPKRAYREGSLCSPHTVVGLLGAITQYQSAVCQFVGDREHRATDPLVLGREEANKWQEQHRGVERVAVVMLGKDAPLVDPALAHVGVDFLRGCRPSAGSLPIGSQCRQTSAAIRRHPAHHLGRGEVLGLAAHLPDAMIRLPPVGQGGLYLGGNRCPGLVREAIAQPSVKVNGVEHPPPYITWMSSPCHASVRNAKKSLASLSNPRACRAQSMKVASRTQAYR